MQQVKRLIQQGYQSLQRNDLQQAFKSFSKVVKVDQNNFDAHFALGSLYSQKGDFESAYNYLRRAVKIKPDSFAAHGQLGVTLYGLQRLEEAINSYRKVIELQPDNVVALVNIAITCLDLGKREEAVRYSSRAIQIKPGFSGAHALLASAYSALGEFEKAVKSYDDALILERDNLVLVAGKVDALNKLGMQDEALQIIRPRLKADSYHPSIAIAYAHVSRSFDDRARAVKIVEQVLKTDSLMHKQRLQLHFAAGDLYDRIEQYDLAFKHYVSGNKLVQRKYDPVADKKLFDNIIKVFSQGNINKLPRVQLLGEQREDVGPVFIIGMPRSGTSLVERIIGRHSSVFPAGELNIVPQAANKISMAAFPEGISDVSISQLNAISQECMDTMTTLAGAKEVITDKLPHNFLFLGLIELLFPNARIIHCKRNPVDTCVSNYFQYFSGPLDYPYSLIDTAVHYNHYQRLMNHWRKVIQLPMFEITYEELVQHQKSVTADMLTFLNLPWEDDCLKFNESEQVTRTASYQQVMKPIYTKSIGRWRYYEKHLGELTNNLSL